MSLYQISSDFEQLFNGYEQFMADAAESGISVEDAEQAWFDTLESMEEDVEERVETIALYIKNISLDAEGLRQERDEFARRLKVTENRINRLKAYILETMGKINRGKIERKQCVVSVRNNAESVKISDEQQFIEWAKANADELLKYKEPEISKTAVKKALQSGQEIPLATLERSQSVIIK